MDMLVSYPENYRLDPNYKQVLIERGLWRERSADGFAFLLDWWVRVVIF
jgi:hypothetical protein